MAQTKREKKDACLLSHLLQHQNFTFRSQKINNGIILKYYSLGY